MCKDKSERKTPNKKKSEKHYKRQYGWDEPGKTRQKRYNDTKHVLSYSILFSSLR